MNGQITNVSVGMDATFATVNLSLEPAASGLSGANITLFVPLDQVENYVPGHQYTVDITPVADSTPAAPATTTVPDTTTPPATTTAPATTTTAGP